jgi:hypothetical protein
MEESSMSKRSDFSNGRTFKPVNVSVLFDKAGLGKLDAVVSSFNELVPTTPPWTRSRVVAALAHEAVIKDFNKLGRAS